MRKLLRSFYPARCPYCGKVTRPFGEGCKNCVSQNPAQSKAFWIYHPYLRNDNIELICCSAWLYWDKPKAAVLRFKFHGRREYAESFGLSMARSVKENFSSVTFDLVCEIPLTKRRRRERGFDQARLLAKELARGLKLPYVSALEKPKGNRIQHELSFAERWENVKGGFNRLKRKIDVRGKTCFALRRHRYQRRDNVGGGESTASARCEGGVRRQSLPGQEVGNGRLKFTHRYTIINLYVAYPG